MTKSKKPSRSARTLETTQLARATGGLSETQQQMDWIASATASIDWDRHQACTIYANNIGGGLLGYTIGNDGSLV